MKTYTSFNQIDQLQSRPDNTTASDETLAHFEAEEQKLQQADAFADMEVAMRIRLARLAREIRAMERDTGKTQAVRAAWRHFFQVKQGLATNGHLGQTQLSAEKTKALRERHIHRCANIQLANKIATQVAKKTQKARIYHHPKYHEFWVFPEGELPQDTSGLIATYYWDGQRLTVNDNQSPQDVVDALQGATRIPFTLTFCLDPHIAETYGEMTIRAYTEEGARTIFQERCPQMTLIDTAHSDACQEDPQAGTDEYTYDPEGSRHGEWVTDRPWEQITQDQLLAYQETLR